MTTNHRLLTSYTLFLSTPTATVGLLAAILETIAQEFQCRPRINPLSSSGSCCVIFGYLVSL